MTTSTNFLTNTDQTGRFIVKSMKTGKVYFVEPIDDRPDHKIWGDMDPATKSVSGSYGSKYRGSVSTDDSLITEQNGFINISLMNGSPLAEIQRRDDLYYAEMQK
jgi:hypothetical protein